MPKRDPGDILYYKFFGLLVITVSVLLIKRKLPLFNEMIDCPIAIPGLVSRRADIRGMEQGEKEVLGIG